MLCGLNGASTKTINCVGKKKSFFFFFFFGTIDSMHIYIKVNKELVKLKEFYLNFWIDRLTFTALFLAGIFHSFFFLVRGGGGGGPLIFVIALSNLSSSLC